jgi:hypothetical protein
MEQTSRFSICPHLGNLDNPGNILHFASEEHVCFRVHPPEHLSRTHQTFYCLSPSFADCSVHSANESSPLPPEARRKPRRMRGGRWLKLYIAMRRVLSRRVLKR